MFVINTPIGYVHGFSNTHQCVQVTNTLGLAKQWKRKIYADKFLAKYSNAGYGLSSDTAKVVEI